MNTDELLSYTISELAHHGVKGQKWGVRKAARKVKSEASLRINSAKRERSWDKLDASSMSTKKLSSTAKRVRLENDLKRHAKRTGSKALKRDYLNRSSISTKDLQAKISRLDLEREFKKTSRKATVGQRALLDDVVKSIEKNPSSIPWTAVDVLSNQYFRNQNAKKQYRK